MTGVKLSNLYNCVEICLNLPLSNIFWHPLKYFFENWPGRPALVTPLQKVEVKDW